MLTTKSPMDPTSINGRSRMCSISPLGYLGSTATHRSNVRLDVDRLERAYPSASVKRQGALAGIGLLGGVGRWGRKGIIDRGGGGMSMKSGFELWTTY